MSGLSWPPEWLPTKRTGLSVGTFSHPTTSDAKYLLKRSMIRSVRAT